MSNYNSVINAADKVDGDAVARRTGNMMNATASNGSLYTAKGYCSTNYSSVGLFNSGL